MFASLFRISILAFFLLSTLSTVEAASLYIDPPSAELNRGDAIELSLRLDVDEAAQECVNAIDAVISYTENIEPVDISIGDSIFSIWVEQPTIHKENRTISFAGGLPNGYCGRVTGDPRLTNNLVKLIFRSPGFQIGSATDDPNARVEFTDQTNVYLNDGFGTKAVPNIFGATMRLSKTAGSGGIVDPWRDAINQDSIPPEEFSINLQKGDLEFSGKYYISFNTTDKQTGIDVYQVMEEPSIKLKSLSWGDAAAPWITTRSPYILKDQTLNSVIYVKAIDKAGNEYIATLLPDEAIRVPISAKAYVNWAVFALIVIILLGCVFIIITFFRQRKKLVKTVPDNSAKVTDGHQSLADSEKPNVENKDE